jgi:hypothetical protein
MAMLMLCQISPPMLLFSQIAPPMLMLFPDSNTNANVDEAADLEPVKEPDLFDNEEEYVGVDDEQLYIPIPPR